ncbi:MAG TPA: hypothetical protein VIH57_12375 [Bacteroidales bacterium]
MKKLVFISVLIIIAAFTAHAQQDTIITTKGEKIACRIMRQTDNKVFYTVGKGYDEASSSINRSEISEIKYAVLTHKKDGAKPSTITLGIGLGMDYGGVGGNILLYPQHNFGIFGGVGYAIAGVGFNAGAKIRFISENSTAKLQPYALAMYGYNAAIAVTDASQYNKLFYGPTLGFGLDFNPNSAKGGYFTLAILVPIRSNDVDKYIDDLKNNHGVEFKNDLLPIGISIGYRFKLN